MNIFEKGGVVFFAVLMIATTAVAEDHNHQSLLLRAVTVTCKVDESIAFYRDVMGQNIIEDVTFEGSGIQRYIDVQDGGKVRFVILGGSGIYPGGQVVGGNIAFMGILDKDDPSCGDGVENKRGQQGSMILPHRVSDIEEIAVRAKAAGHEILFDVKPSGTGLSRNMMLYDPNGNIVEVFQINTAIIK